MPTAFVFRTLIVGAYLVPALWHGNAPAVFLLTGALLLIWAVPLVRDRRRERTAGPAAAAMSSSLRG